MGTKSLTYCTVGVNETLSINGKTVCSTGTTYGTETNVETNAGNEQNHLIKIDSCYDTDIYQNDVTLVFIPLI